MTLVAEPEFLGLALGLLAGRDAVQVNAAQFALRRDAEQPLVAGQVAGIAGSGNHEPRIAGFNRLDDFVFGAFVAEPDFVLALKLAFGVVVQEDPGFVADGAVQVDFERLFHLQFREPGLVLRQLGQAGDTGLRAAERNPVLARDVNLALADQGNLGEFDFRNQPIPVQREFLTQLLALGSFLIRLRQRATGDAGRVAVQRFDPADAGEIALPPVLVKDQTERVADLDLGWRQGPVGLGMDQGARKQESEGASENDE